MKNVLIFTCIALLLTLTACSYNKNRMPLNHNDFEDIELTSQIVLNYRLDKKTLQDTFNVGIDESLSEEFVIPEYDLKMKLSKSDIAKVEIEGKNILVIVPINVWVEKKTFLSTLKARGTLEMTFLTQFDIDTLWNLKTATNLSYHRWIEKPKLGIAGISIPITFLSDNVLKRSKNEIEKTIDEAIRDNFLLKDKMAELLTAFDEPQQFDPTFRAWVHFKPSHFELNNIVNSRFTARGKIRITGTTVFSTYKPERDASPQKMPQVSWSETLPDSSIIKIVSDIKTYDINTLLKENIDGKTFSADGKSITLSNIVTNCDFEKMRITTDVQGSFNGKLFISAIPQYDKDKNRFQLKISDIKFKTKNIFHSAAAWLGENKIKNEIEKKLVFNIDDQVAEVQKSINTYTKNLQDTYDMDLNIKLGSVVIEKFKLYPGQIEAILAARVHLDAHIKDLRKFSQFGFR